MSVDPRAWNIAAGLCVAAGCGGRTIAEGGSEVADATTVGEVSGTEQTATTGPECMSASDCPPGYGCYGGECVYYGGVDGHLDHSDYGYGSCYSDADCAPFELCSFDDCAAVPSPAACPSADMPLAIPVSGVALALSFVDADADAADELAVATATELHVFEAGVDTPTISPRTLESLDIDAMVGGEFDMTVGDDLVLLVDDQLYTHGSNGDGSFAAPSVTPSSLPTTLGLESGPFDAPLDDLLVWGEAGASLQLTAGASVQMSGQVVHAAAARSLASPMPGYALMSGTRLEVYSSAGALLASTDAHGTQPVALTSFAELGSGYDLSATSVESFEGPWALMQSWQAGLANQGESWALAGQVTRMRSGDFDGDGRADLALIAADTVSMQIGTLGERCVSTYPLTGVARELAVGDHDGDGDDELAVRMSTGEVWLIDGG